MAISFSIVIPSHNRPDLLAVCLSHVQHLAPPGTEIIVVDDGSPDCVVTKAATCCPHVQALRLPRRRGFCVAANAGIRSASGEVVELLNDDTEVTPGWAGAALKAFQDARVAAVAPLVLYMRGHDADQGPRVDSAGDRYYVGGIAGKRGHGELLGPAHQLSGRVFGASGSTAFYRRQVLLDVGAFPEHFGAYFEDVDVAFRLHQAGYQVHFEPRSRVFHHVSSSYGRPRRRLLEQQACNEERVFWRNLPSAALGRALPRHLAVLAAKAWRRWHDGGLNPFLWGRLRLLLEVPDLKRHRRGLKSATGPDLTEWSVETEYWGALA